MSNSVAAGIIATKILIIRGERVMLDSDLAVLYGVKTGRLEEALNLKSHFATSSWGGVRKLPSVFTQEGVAMLSSVLNSERAIMVNIQIMRAFAQLRRMLLTNADLRRKLEEMDRQRLFRGFR